MITVDLLMSTKPCERWPRDRVEALLACSYIDCSSWVRFAESCLAADAVSLADLRHVAYSAATPDQRLVGVRRSVRVCAESGCNADGCMVAYVAAEAADAASAANGFRFFRAAHAADAAARMAAYAVGDAASGADSRPKYIGELRAGLLFICSVLDGEVQS